MGRTGTLWAHEQLGVAPDVMTVAKGLGGGLPIGACVANPESAGVLEPGDHGSTFAGGPVIAAAANAVLDVLTEPGFLETVTGRGERLADGPSRARPRAARPRPDDRLRPARGAPRLARRLLLDQRLVVHATGPETDPHAAAADCVRGRGRRGRAPAGRGASLGCRSRWPKTAAR